MTPGRRDKWEGRVEATLESIKEEQKEIKTTLKEDMKEIKTIFTKHTDWGTGKSVEFDKRLDKVGNRVTAVEIKSGLFGTVGGIVGGVLSGLFRR